MTIKEYWILIGREPFLAITWKLDFSQACSFCRMLINQKNFHFTHIPDKTNDHVFRPFWPFLVIFAQWGFFPKHLAVTHNYNMDPYHHAKFQKKLMSQFRENLQTDGRMDGRMEGWTDRQTGSPCFTEPFRLWLGV